MKKVGIITFNRALNYGAVLQAYAMKKVCEEMGFTTQVIDYNKGKDEKTGILRTFFHSSHAIRDYIRLIKSILSLYWDQKRWKAFKLFRKKYLDETKNCEDISDISDLGFDFYISGSDQIWNYNITGGDFDPVYFGDMGNNAAVIVYGASAHDTPFPLDKEIELSELLKKSKAPIGIREHRLAEYIGKLTGTQYPVVIDPTLLAGKEIFELIKTDWKPRNPYILLYQIDKNPASDISIRSLEKRFKCKVYSMTVPKVGSMHGKKGAEGPAFFISAIEQAKFVVTNSFHGVALSLLFHKQFYVYENGGVMTRIDDLLESIGLRDRKVKVVNDINVENKIDYKKADSILQELRNKSLTFLEKAFQGDQQLLKFDSIQHLKPFSDREKQECSGCSACVEVCPVGAISMQSDEEGFLYPLVDHTKCIHCQKCDEFCSFLESPKSITSLPDAYGVKHKLQTERNTSRSGGAFIALAEIVLRDKGVVYGAAFENYNKVVHIRAEKKEDLDRMKGAKYVQSDLRDILTKVIQDLKEEKKVLFSGTPCQVAGLKKLLEDKKLNDDNLITCDLVCHGVPSPQVWYDYCNYIQKKYKSQIVKADFRDKTYGWDTHLESFMLSNGKKIVSRDYADLFYSHTVFRPSCYNCKFANMNRVGDISLADFWGIEKNDASFDDNNGVSLVLVNNKKGMDAFLNACKDLDIITCNVLNCLQPTLIKPSEESPFRDSFWETYREKDLESAMKMLDSASPTVKILKKKIKHYLYAADLRKHP